MKGKVNMRLTKNRVRRAHRQKKQPQQIYRGMKLHRLCTDFKKYGIISAERRWIVHGDQVTAA
jgi:hypothetical protein